MISSVSHPPSNSYLPLPGSRSYRKKTIGRFLPFSRPRCAGDSRSDVALTAIPANSPTALKKSAGLAGEACTMMSLCTLSSSSSSVEFAPQWRADRAWFPREDCNSSSYTQNPSNPNRYGRFKPSEEQKQQKTKFYSQHSEYWKRKSCPHSSTSRRCSFRQTCIYAHGDEELKKLGVGSWEAGGKSVAPAPFKVSPRLSEHVQPGSSLPRATDLTLAKCKRIYGDWID